VLNLDFMIKQNLVATNKKANRELTQLFNLIRRISFLVASRTYFYERTSNKKTFIFQVGENSFFAFVSRCFIGRAFPATMSSSCFLWKPLRCFRELLRLDDCRRYNKISGPTNYYDCIVTCQLTRNF
jgi:hypothetical protein